MKQVYDILNKAYDHKLVKHKSYKRRWKELCSYLETRDIRVEGTRDTDCFHYEIVEQSIRIKERFEEVFFDTYVTMHDYWYDLNYLERKKQMNIEIEKLKEELICFPFAGQDIYMPCFPEKFNHLYSDEIVLLDLKQYHKFIRTFAQQICRDHYGVYPYVNGFSSAHVLGSEGTAFVLYHELSARLYHYRDGQVIHTISLDHKRIDNNQEILYTLAEQLIKEDETALLETLLSSSLFSTRMHKKLLSYQRKEIKRTAKKKKQELKKELQE